MYLEEYHYEARAPTSIDTCWSAQQGRAENDTKTHTNEK